MEDPTRAVEQWARDAGIPIDAAAFGGRPIECLMRFARLAFEAGRAKGLEEAAKVCERKVDSALGIVLGPDCAYAIRSLAPAETSEGDAK